MPIRRGRLSKACISVPYPERLKGELTAELLNTPFGSSSALDIHLKAGRKTTAQVARNRVNLPLLARPSLCMCQKGVNTIGAPGSF